LKKRAGVAVWGSEARVFVGEGECASSGAGEVGGAAGVNVPKAMGGGPAGAAGAAGAFCKCSWACERFAKTWRVQVSELMVSVSTRSRRGGYWDKVTAETRELGWNAGLCTAHTDQGVRGSQLWRARKAMHVHCVLNGQLDVRAGVADHARWRPHAFALFAACIHF
jgi:hypothetical protein